MSGEAHIVAVADEEEIKTLLMDGDTDTLLAVTLSLLYGITARQSAEDKIPHWFAIEGMAKLLAEIGKDERRKNEDGQLS